MASLFSGLGQALGAAAVGYGSGQIKGEQEQFRRQQIEEQNAYKKLLLAARLKEKKDDPFKLIREHASRQVAAIDKDLNAATEQDNINSIPGFREQLLQKRNRALRAMTDPDPTKWFSEEYSQDPEAPPDPDLGETPREAAWGPVELKEAANWFTPQKITAGIFSPLPPRTPAATVATAAAPPRQPAAKTATRQRLSPLEEIQQLNNEIDVLETDPQSVMPQRKGQTAKAYEAEIQKRISAKSSRIQRLSPLIVNVPRGEGLVRDLAAGGPEARVEGVKAGTKQKEAKTLETLTLLKPKQRLMEARTAAIPQQVQQGWKRLDQGDRRLTETERHNLVTEAQGWRRIKDVEKRTASMIKKAQFLIDNFDDAELGRNNRALLGAMITAYGARMNVAGVISTSKMAGVDDPLSFVPNLAKQIGMKTGTAPAQPAAQPPPQPPPSGFQLGTRTTTTQATTRTAAAPAATPSKPAPPPAKSRLSPKAWQRIDEYIDADMFDQILAQPMASDPNVRKELKARYRRKKNREYGQ